MKKEMNIEKYWTEAVDRMTTAWNIVSGKALKDAKDDNDALLERMSGLEIDIEALKIKLASTEIDLKASEIEKETIKMQLEEKKMLLVDVRLKLNQIESSTISSDIEMSQVIKQLKAKEEENENLRKKVLNVINMLCTMSENERYQDIIKIKTNTIDEQGTENHSLYITYAGQTVEVNTQDALLAEQKPAQEKATSNEKIINFNPQAMFEADDELVEMAE